MSTLLQNRAVKIIGLILLLIFLPFIPVGFLIYKAFEKLSGFIRIVALAVLALVFVFSLMWSWVFVSAIKSPNTTTQNNQIIQQSPSPSPIVQPTSSPEIKQNETFKVVRVIDGDTIEIEGGQRVRYIGIDTPETVDPRKPVQCFGKEASDKNKELVAGKEVKLEKDVSETDKYGRLLRYVYVGNIFANDYLVRQGYAHASSYPPDVKYQDQFTQAQTEARVNHSGLWGSACQSDSGITGASSGLQAAPQGCLIKGNINSSGERIYHMPGQRYYDKTVIGTSKSERWFCTEDEAIAAGWRKSKV